MEYLEPQEEFISPIIPIEFDGETVVLDWANTRIRTFPDAAFNHVEFLDNEGDLAATSSQRLMDVLFENGFSVLSMPYVDQETLDWVISMETHDLDSIEPEDFEVK